MTESTALLSIQEQIRAELAHVRGTVAPPSGNKISTKGKVFTLPGGVVHHGPLECVILDHRNYNRYDDKPYDPNQVHPPACFALGKHIDTMAPHEDAPAPQHAECATCPMNAWGSASTGRGKACRNKVRLALVPTDADPDTEPMTLEIPPKALASWSRLVNNLEVRGLLPLQVRTAIGFDPNQAYPLPTFSVLGAHEDLELFWGLREKAQIVLDQPPAS